MHSLLFDKLFPSIAWTFVHSLWQGLVLSIVAGSVLLMTSRTKAAHRYTLLLSVFVLFIVSVGITFFMVWSGTGRILQPGQGALSSSIYSSFKAAINNVAVYLDANASWLVLGWFLIFLFNCARIILDIREVRRLRGNSLHEVQREWANTVTGLVKKLGITKPVALFQSSLIKAPVTMGYFKPLILVPLGMLGNMPASQMEAVLIHELAHIRRHDYLVNLLQRITESIFFFNPAVLWISSVLRTEREACCDEIAITHTGSKGEYVEALIHCKEFSLRTPGFALGFFGTKNLLLHRLNRIVYDRNKKMSSIELGFFVVSIILLIALIATVGVGTPLRSSAKPHANTVSKQVYVSEVFPGLATGTKETTSKDKPGLLLPPPPDAPMGSNGQDQIEVDLKSNNGTFASMQANKDETSAESERAKQIEINEMKSPG